MKVRLLIACVLVAAAYMALTTETRLSTPIKPDGIPQASETPPSRIYKDASGREVHIATPLLDKFSYAGDADLCIELREMTKSNAEAAEELLDACDDISTGSAVEISQKRIWLATMLGDGDEEYTYSLSDNEIDRNKRVVLAISMLRAALDAAAPDAAKEAFSALDSLWIANDASGAFAGYNPPFLFRSAMKAEAGEALLALCPIAGRSDCDSFVPSGMPKALEELGRWKSDEALLLRSAELLEREYRAIKDPSKSKELDFAQDFSATLGYANELNPGNGSAHARRGVKPLEEWLGKYENSTDERALRYIYSTVGAAYGRIASDSQQRADAEKAVKFNSLTFEIARKLDKDGPSWENMANLGDDTLLLAELNREEAGFQKALKLHRDAYVITEKLNSQDATAYMNMKLALTLQHYAKAELPSVTKNVRIAMLEEAVNLAEGVKPLFEQTGTALYLRMTNGVLGEANAQLISLRQSN
ncbi:hypothetical protein [Rhizobium laguerreae]|uniref:hypothetical protein n=1 Tax=Rhizobium laguerreae TaxID=1076926 RepID=UPI001C904E51|nr:hypothetical protein [Rhizobium laguerreae]MBY3344736.1 hypothetical protein [Rhizobium laguerreae]MBY3351769.1 hypothetical protein [Rhizobium laguerreae]MBY3372443.1 hypothetical protein [Rhizobium laguerreae]MBY3427610.1 hypothetical protein [Rhizobium laguerreae]MBY3436620.1 hypothetical protein [Rhizobium laguerreae]